MKNNLKTYVVTYNTCCTSTTRIHYEWEPTRIAMMVCVTGYEGLRALLDDMYRHDFETFGTNMVRWISDIKVVQVAHYRRNASY